VAARLQQHTPAALRRCYARRLPAEAPSLAWKLLNRRISGIQFANCFQFFKSCRIHGPNPPRLWRSFLSQLKSSTQQPAEQQAKTLASREEMAAQRVQCAAAHCDDRWLLEAHVPREKQDEWHRIKREYSIRVLASRERERAAKAEYERLVREMEARKERAREALRTWLQEHGVRPEDLGKKLRRQLYSPRQAAGWG